MLICQTIKTISCCMCAHVQTHAKQHISIGICHRQQTTLSLITSPNNISLKSLIKSAKSTLEPGHCCIQKLKQYERSSFFQNPFISLSIAARIISNIGNPQTHIHKLPYMLILKKLTLLEQPFMCTNINPLQSIRPIC